MITRSPQLLSAAAAALLLGACAAPQHTAELEVMSQGTMVANTRSEGGGHSRPAMEIAGDAEGIVRLGGRLYYVKDHGTSLLRGPQRVTGGLVLERNGEVTVGDGRRVRVIEGYMVTRTGDVIEAPGYLRH